MNLLNNQNKRPRSQIVCSVICKNDYAEYKENAAVGGISGELPPNWFSLNKEKSVTARCSKLSNILHLHKITHIDFFSLDVEGGELNVLEKFDFSIYICYWVIEFNSHNEYKNKMIRKILLDNGYTKYSIKLSHSKG